MSRSGRHWRALKAAGLSLLLAGGAGLMLDRMFPPDLSRLSRSSAMVLDSEGGLLRAFTTETDIWRLPARRDQVDPLYLAMLLAYEDKRFRHHPGVDPLDVEVGVRPRPDRLVEDDRAAGAIADDSWLLLVARGACDLIAADIPLGLRRGNPHDEDEQAEQQR